MYCHLRNAEDDLKYESTLKGKIVANPNLSANTKFGKQKLSVTKDNFKDYC